MCFDTLFILSEIINKDCCISLIELRKAKERVSRESTTHGDSQFLSSIIRSSYFHVMNIQSICMCIISHTHTHANTHTHTLTQTHMHLYAYACVFVSYAYLYIYICIYNFHSSNGGYSMFVIPFWIYQLFQQQFQKLSKENFSSQNLFSWRTELISMKKETTQNNNPMSISLYLSLYINILKKFNSYDTEHFM